MSVKRARQNCDAEHAVWEKTSPVCRLSATCLPSVCRLSAGWQQHGRQSLNLGAQAETTQTEAQGRCVGGSAT